jgi:hypothetical protein
MGLFRPEDLTKRFSSAQNSKASFLVRSPGKGRAPHARMGTPWLPPYISPLGHPSCAHPPGGAGSARPQCRHNAYPNVSSIWPPASRQLVRDHDALGFAPGPYSRARRPRPSEKIALRVISGLSPQGHLTLARPPEGRALHARKRKFELDRDIFPFGRGPSLTHVVEMECLGASSALPPGRGDRAPPRKPPCALSPGSPRKATSSRLVPLEGRALHARNDALSFPRACPH